MSEFERLVKWIDFKSSRQKDWLYPRLRKKGYGHVVDILEHSSSSTKATATSELITRYESDPQFWIEMVNLRNGWRNYKSTTKRKREKPTVKLSCDVLNQTRTIIKELADNEGQTQGEIVDRLISTHITQGDRDYIAIQEKKINTYVSDLEDYLSNEVRGLVKKNLIEKAGVESISEFVKKFFKEFADWDT